MKLKDLRVGTAVDIRYLQAVKDENSDVPKDTYRTDVYDSLSDTEIEINVPFSHGKPVILPSGVRFEMVFLTDKGMFKGIGTVTGRYKREGFPLFKVEIKKELERFQRREFFRIACSIPVVFSVMEEEEAELEDMDEIMEAESKPEAGSVRGMGTILDISGGGIRFSSSVDLSAWHFLLLQFNLEHDGQIDKLELVAVLMGTELPEGGAKYINRVRILFKNSDYQEKIVRYIFEEERRIRRKGLE